jgi:hypothetical protein
MMNTKTRTKTGSFRPRSMYGAPGTKAKEETKPTPKTGVAYFLNKSHKKTV